LGPAGREVDLVLGVHVQRVRSADHPLAAPLAALVVGVARLGLGDPHDASIVVTEQDESHAVLRAAEEAPVVVVGFLPTWRPSASKPSEPLEAWVRAAVT
jgi:hypothetical protein